MPLVIYTLLRLALFGAAFGLLYAVGLRGWLLPIIAVVVALAVSYLTLRRPRDAATQWMADRAARRTAARAADTSHEDAELDAKLHKEA